MTLPRLVRLLVLLSLAAGLRAADPAYLFTYFTKNGEDGLHLAWSEDGYRWQALGDGRSFLIPTVGKNEKLMRDPCVVAGPDGTYHLVWTTGWTETGIGYASTKDFITWSEPREIPVMAHVPGVRNCWAPEIAYDGERGEFLIFWASTVPGRFPETAGASESDYNHRIYFTATKDFQTFTPAEIFYEPGFSVIDATHFAAGGKHYLVIKDETVNPPRKFLQVAVADAIRGPYRDLSPPITPPRLWVEGPAALQVGQETLVYFDAYRDRHYGAVRTQDFQTWENVSDRISFPAEGLPERVRHGTAIAVPRALVDRLMTAAAQSGRIERSTAPAPDVPAAGLLRAGRLVAAVQGGVGDEQIRLAAGVATSAGNLLLRFDHGNVGEAENYFRELDQADAAVRVGYAIDGVRYRREAFASEADKVVVLRFQADLPGRITFTLGPATPAGVMLSAPTPKELRLVAGAGVFQVRVLNRGGTVESGATGLAVRGANEVVLLIAPEAADLAAAAGKSYSVLRNSRFSR